jgi:hypothetical protein
LYRSGRGRVVRMVWRARRDDAPDRMAGMPSLTCRLQNAAFVCGLAQQVTTTRHKSRISRRHELSMAWAVIGYFDKKGMRRRNRAA